MQDVCVLFFVMVSACGNAMGVCNKDSEPHEDIEPEMEIEQCDANESRNPTPETYAFPLRKD